jgi:glycosyltransferase involved in cell wall biosynthesis
MQTAMMTIESEPKLAIDNGVPFCPPADENAVTRVNKTLNNLEQLAAVIERDEFCGQIPSNLNAPPGVKLSVVIPVYNEEATIRQVLENVAALPIATEIIVIDDASTDGTRQALAEYEHRRNISVIFKPRNEGKGAALRTGFRRVSGDVVIVQDADLEYDPSDILSVIQPIIDGQADVVYGSRFLEESRGSDSSIHRWGNACLTQLSNWFTGLQITDMETCYKAFRREVLASFEIQQPRFGFEPEVTARIARRKYRVCEVPIRYSPRGYAEGKKIGVKDLFSALYSIIRYGLAD